MTQAARGRLGAICADLPEAEWNDWGQHVQYRVRKKTFAYLLDDHHGDGILGVVAKAAPGEARGLIEGDPSRYYAPAYLHHQGWVGLRLDVEPVDWEEVAGLVTDSYVLVAPKRLVREASGKFASSPGEESR